MKIKKNSNNDDLGRRRSSSLPENSATRYSYHSVRSDNASKNGRINREEQESKSKVSKNNWLKHSPSYLAALVVIASLIYSISLGTNPRVTVIGQTSQTVMQPVSVYQNSAQQILSNSAMNKTKLTINTDKIAAELQKEFPELDGVSIVVPLLGHQPVLEIRPSQSLFILSNSEGQYVINQQGEAVLKVDPGVASQYNLPVVTDQTGFKVVIGQDALPSTSVTFIKEVVDQFAAKGQAIESITLSTTPYELDVRVRGVPYYIKFSLLADPVYSIGTYFATVKLFGPTNPAPSQYVDVRIPGRAYYK